MFKELLAIYKSADDKTNLFKDQIPEDIYEAVMSALETEDESKFNNLMKVDTGSISKEPVETTPVGSPQDNAPIVKDTGSLVEDSTLEEGPIVDQPEFITDDQQRVILPTLNAVIEMTNNIQSASDEEIENLPEDIKEGVEIWKDADDDFSIKIIAKTVDKFHNGDFSEIETPSDKDILITGAEIAKELRDKGENKTSLDRATESIQAELENARLSDLLRIHGELCSMEAKAEDLVEDVIEKNNLAISPSKKDEIVIKVLDNIYEDSDKDEFKKSVATALNDSGDYSSRDMSERFNIFNDFSEIELELDEGLSPDTAELLESVNCFKDARNVVEEAITDEMKENPCAFDKSFEASINAESFIDSAKGHARSAFNLFKDYISDKKNLAKIGGAAAGAVVAIPAAKAISNTEEGDTTGDKIVKKGLGIAIPVAAAIGGKKIVDTIQKAGDNSKDCSEQGDMGEIKLTDKLRNKFDNAKTNNPFIINEGFLPSRPVAKFMYDVEKESDYNKLLSGITDENLKNQMITEKDKIDQSKTKGMGLIPQFFWYGPTGAVYHTSKKDVNDTNNLLHEMEKYQEFAEKDTVSTVKRALNSVLGLYPKQVSSSNRSEYWDAVKEVAKLSDEDKQKIFNNMYSTNKKRTGNKWINAVARSVLPNPVTYPVSVAAGIAQNCTIPNRYRVANNEAQSILAGDNSMNKRDFAEGEAPAEEQISQEVIDNALSNDDQIRALVEKYKMLPTIEAKEQMKADMHTLGFNDEVIEMIENYAEGNFSEGEGTSTEACPNCGQNPCVCGTTTEETVDVASIVAPELFDSLLGPGVGESDPVDGTLPVGEVEAPGTDIGHLGTLDEGIPAGEPAPEDNRDVTKVEIVNSDGDEFESIMR